MRKSVAMAMAQTLVVAVSLIGPLNAIVAAENINTARFTVKNSGAHRTSVSGNHAYFMASTPIPSRRHSTSSGRTLLVPEGPKAGSLPSAHAFMAYAQPRLDKNSAKRNMLITSGVSAVQNHIDLTVGKAEMIQLKRPASRVSISDPAIASAVIISPTQIQVVGKQVGVANLMVWESAYSPEHTVVDLSVQYDVSTLSKQLKQLDPGINVMPLAAEDSVILTGEAQSAESAQLAVEIARAFFAKKTTATPSAKNISSNAPGSAMPDAGGNVINLIRVKGQPSTKLELVRERLKDISPGIKLDIVPGVDGSEKALLTGDVQKSGMVSRAINLVSAFYGKAGLKVLTGPGGNAIRNSGKPGFQDGSGFSDNIDINVLQGSVITDETGNVISLLKVMEKPQVRCNIKFMDISRTALNQLGGTIMGTAGDQTYGSFSGAHSPLTGKTIATLDGDNSGASNLLTNVKNLISGSNTQSRTSSYGAAQTLGDGITQVLTINNNFIAAISALEEKRKVRSLAEPTLMMLSGEKASFLAGGEVPIPVLGPNGQIQIEYKEFGIRLNLIATVTDEGRIHMQVAPEISALDPSNAITTSVVSIPGFRTRRMQSTLELVNGQSLVLAGLFNQEETESVSRFPGIGTLPIIGSFFRNRWADRRDNEMIVVIRPEIISNLSGNQLGSAGL